MCKIYEPVWTRSYCNSLWEKGERERERERQRQRQRKGAVGRRRRSHGARWHRHDWLRQQRRCGSFPFSIFQFHSLFIILFFFPPLKTLIPSLSSSFLPPPNRLSGVRRHEEAVERDGRWSCCSTWDAGQGRERNEFCPRFFYYALLRFSKLLFSFLSTMSFRYGESLANLFVLFLSRGLGWSCYLFDSVGPLLIQCKLKMFKEMLHFGRRRIWISCRKLELVFEFLIVALY